VATAATAVTTVVIGDNRDKFEWDSEFSCFRQHKTAKQLNFVETI
jgi:hypothetical protein